MSDTSKLLRVGSAGALVLLLGTTTNVLAAEGGGTIEEVIVTAQKRAEAAGARALVRKVAAYTFPGPVGFSVVAGSGQDQANRGEALLREVARQNDLDRLDADLCVESSVLGDAAMKITWDAARERPVVAAVDPATLFARTAADRPRELLELTQRYTMQGRELIRLAGEQRLLPAA